MIDGPISRGITLSHLLCRTAPEIPPGPFACWVSPPTPTGHPFLLALMPPAVGQDATGGPARHGIEQANKLSYYSALTPQPGRLLIILGVRATRTGLDANL